MFQIYYYNYHKIDLGLCTTKESGARRMGYEIKDLVFVESHKSYDYFTVHLEVDGFGNDDAILYSARTVQECEEYIRLHRDGDRCGILGQKFGQEVRAFWD